MISPQTYNIKILTIQNFNKIHVKIVKNMSMQNSWTSKCKNDAKLYIHNFYTNNVSFLLVMFRCEICTICILTKFL
jgi:hypothetical protein